MAFNSLHRMHEVDLLVIKVPQDSHILLLIRCLSLQHNFKTKFNGARCFNFLYSIHLLSFLANMFTKVNALISDFTGRIANLSSRSRWTALEKPGANFLPLPGSSKHHADITTNAAPKLQTMKVEVARVHFQF